MMREPILTASKVKREVHSNSEKIVILDDINMVLQTGEAVAVQGASGSGKSTLLGLLAGLDLPQQGQITMAGQDITRLDEDHRAGLRAGKVGFVFQSFHLVENLTALENVALPLELFGYKRPVNTAKKWLERLGLAARAKHLPQQLSGGEQQRVALCRAFAIEPILLFADEPTANLDAVTAQTVLDELFALQSEFGTSMIISTHDQSLSQRCDRVLHLHAGRLEN